MNNQKTLDALTESRLNEGLEVGRQKSKLIGDNVEAMQESGLTFWQALETTLKAYDL